MAQTIEEIAELLKTLKLDTEISTEETEKVLASINSKMDSIADDYAANQLLKDYLVDLRSELQTRHDFNVNKYTEFEQAFNIINNAQQLAVKSSDLDGLIQKVGDNLDTLKNSFFDKSNENLQNITNQFEKINSSLDKVNDEVSERISLNFDTTRDLIENITNEISKQHENLRNEKQSSDAENIQKIQGLADDIRALGENLALQSNNYRELMELKTSDVKDYINSNSAALASSQAASENKLAEKLSVLENLSHGFEANIIDVNNNLQSIIQNLMTMDPTVQNDIVKRELENIYLATNGILSAMQIYDQKNDELAKIVSNLLTKENFDAAQQRIDDVLERLNDMNSHLTEINLSLDFDSVANKIDGLAVVVDSVKNLVEANGIDEELSSKIDDLKGSLAHIITQDDFNAFRHDLTDFIQKIVDNANFLNSDIVDNKEKIEQILKSLQSLDFMDRLNDIAKNVEEISTGNLNAITTGVNEMTAKLDDISFDFHQKADENAENITNAVMAASTKLDFLHNYIANDIPANFNDIKEMSEGLKDFVSEINEAYKMEGSVLEEKISTKLFELEKTFVENVDKYYEKLSELKEESESFNHEFAEVLNSKTDDIVFALEPLKTSLQQITDCDFSTNLTALKEQLEQIFANVNTNMQMSLSQNQTFAEGLDKIYNDTVEKINTVNETLNAQAQSNLEMIKSVVAEINQSVANSLNSNSEMLAEWKNLLTNIDAKVTELSSNNENSLANVAVDVTNALNSKLESVLEDLKGHIGVPVTANDLVWSVDNLKSELSAKFAELENKQSSKDDDSDAKAEILLILNQLGVKIEELGLRYSNDEFNEIIGNNRMQLMSGLKDLKNIILIAMKEVAKSSAESMDVMHEKLDALLQKGSDDELSGKFDAKADEILAKLDSVNSLENAEALIALNSKIDGLGENAEKNIQALGAVYEKVDVLSENDDKIANSLVSIAEKFGGLRQNTEQLTNEITSVNETVEAINIRGEGVSSTITEISEKTAEVIQKTDEINQGINIISDKIDTFATADEQITQALDLISDKLDDNETKEQLTQGMQFLNDKMDSLNESDERIARTIDVVLDKLETNSVSDDAITGVLNTISDKIDALDTNSGVVDSVGELSHKIEILGSNNEQVRDILSSVNDKIETLGSDNEQTKDILGSVNDKIGTLGSDSEQTRDILSSVNDKIEMLGSDNEQSKDILASIENKVESVGENADRVSEKLDVLSEKVDSFSENDDRIVGALDTIAEKVDILTADTQKEQVVSNLEILNDKVDAIVVVDDKIASSLDSINEKTETTALRCEHTNELLNELNSKVDDIGSDNEKIAGSIENIENTKEHITTVLDMLNEKADATHDYDAKIVDAMEGLSAKMDTFSIVDDELLRKTSEISEKADNISSVADQMTGVLNNVAENSGKIHDVSLAVDKVADFTKNIASAIGNVSEKIDSNDKDVKQSLAEFGQKFDDFAFNDGTIVKTMEVLSDKIDVFKFNTNNEHIVSSLDSLHEKVTDCHAGNEKIADAVDVVSSKIDTFAEADDRIDDKLADISDKVASIQTDNSDILNNLQDFGAKVDDLNRTGEQIETVTNFVNDKVEILTDKVDNCIQSGDHIESTLQLLQDKVVALSEKDVFEGFDVEGEIKNITSMIAAQRQYLEDTEISERTIAMDDCLQSLQKKIENISKDVKSIDIESNANDIKESLMAAIADVFEQISFIEETEEIKGFVEEKTDEISKHIKVVQNQLQKIASSSGEDDYTYSLQDVESDIAKLRLVLNKISDDAPNDELNQLSENVSKIENTVRDLQTTLTQEEFAKFKKDFDKINEDIVSISSRTNTLLLNSDNSYKSLSEGLAAFKGMVNNLNEKVNYLDNTEIQKRIERKIASINNAMIASANSNKVIREVLMYLGEWMDTTTENINAITEKTSEIEDVKTTISDLKNYVPEKDKLSKTLQELRNYVPQREDLFKTLEDKFEEQQERIDRLEVKLEKVLSVLEESDDTKLNKKVDKIEKLINKLNENVEKLASYVDEE